VVEPGRLYLEEALPLPSTHRFWIVNSDDFAQPIPLRGIDVDVSASLGKCGDLEATAVSRRRDAETAVPGVAIGSCTPGSGGKLRLHIDGPPVGQGSFLVTVRKKSGS